MSTIKLPLISIITVVYNSGKTLEKTILSVINQTYQQLEYIIIDGGSTDNTIDIIKKYDKKITYWHSEPDEGIYDAMNKGLTHVHGDWIYFLGADDILHNTLHFIAPQLQKNNIIYYGNVIMIPSLKRYCGKINKFTILKRNICHQAIFYPKKVFEQKNFNTKYQIYADYAFNLECMSNKHYQYQYLNIDIADYNEKGTSSKTQDNQFIHDRRNLAKNFPTIHYVYYLLRVELILWLKKLNHE